MRTLVTLLLPGLLAGAANGATIAVYESETNAATYHGAYQAPLREWLTRNGTPGVVIGDATAGDPAQLARFDVVLTSSTYLVPDAACAGLAQYVAEGGSLIWIDGPARCTNQDLLRTLGVEGGYTYVAAPETAFTIRQPESPATAGVTDFRARALGNPALRATGDVLATWTPVGEGTGTFPAVTVTRTGRGRAVLLNWIMWLSESTAARLLGNVLDWCLAPRSLADHAVYAHLIGTPPEATQPAAVTSQLRLFGRPDLAGRSSTLRAQLVGPTGGRPAAAEVKVALKPVAGEALSFAWADVSVPTQGLADGTYTLSVTGSLAGQAVSAEAQVRLNADALARLAREQAARAVMLRKTMGTILGDYDAEPRTPEGRVDLPRLFQQIAAAHMTMYDFLIWHAETDWEDFQLFLPEAKKRGLKVWVTLAPPSEPPPSAPFGLDFVRWAEEIAQLSLRYDNLVAMVIDDFDGNLSPGVFSPDTVAEVASTLRRVNPRLTFLPTVYWGTIGNADFIKQYGPHIDGIVFPYAELESAEPLRGQLEACRRWLGPDRLLLINVYASGSSGPAEKGPRSAEYMRSVLTTSRELCDGIRIYCLPKGDFTDYRFAITAELYGKWTTGK